MEILPFLIQVIGLVCLLCAALNISPSGKVAMGWAGMFLWLLSLMVTGIGLHQAH